ncbi:E3 SUMO-protein ligase RanBP2 isoform X2 [Homalodisca vitripennis]|uniref:E3 SUMO-protein ligase RanBP2 isoform X2 n=1 Tax=Homalodisca vitripennis TaxID=197043 RepID=UPI001EE9BC4F|nr:E3 SUMO-protein ligase RanBP2 isoform X2 [Homalodisca vitripennis]
MFRSKKDVDRHVQDLLRKIKSENERNLRCYHIAQQYYKVQDYESAKNYISLYLSVKEDSPLAHKLHGQIWEGLGDKVRALNAYKTSLEYEANQPELVKKMCELLCEPEVVMECDRARYWCERGADLFPYDPSVFRLKEKLLKLGGKVNNRDFEDLINSEMKARPSDVSVRTRLMRLYLETGRTRAAFDHAVELEASQLFRKELTWYECFAQVCQAFADEFPSQVNWQMYYTWLSVLDKVASFSLSELSIQKKLVDCVQAIFRMDQVLFKAASAVAQKDYAELYNQFIRHMTAQLCLHIATLIWKRAKREPSTWVEAKRGVSIVLFLALYPPPDTEAHWCLALKPNWKKSVLQWANDAYYRVSQAGYCLLALSKDVGDNFTLQVVNAASNNWRERTFQRIFMVLEHRTAIGTSHFVHSEYLAKVSARLPTHDTGILRTRQLVPVYEKVRETLHHLVWLGLENIKHNDKKLPPDFHTYSFTQLKMANPNLSNMSPETLSVLDVDAFLYATVLCAAAVLEQEMLSEFYSNDRPKLLPADITSLLCTQEQMNWWTSACQVNTQMFSSGTDLIQLRQQLKRGLEVIRMDGKHGLDVQLIVKLARTFEDRAAILNEKSEDYNALVNRASLYWTTAIPLLERVERNQAVRVSDSKLFDYPRKELSTAEVSSLLEEGRYFVACQLMKASQHERAIEAFKPLRSPYASFNQALIYKKLAAGELEGKPKEEITSEMRSKHVILLTKARECLNLTKERIRIEHRHPLHQTLQEHISEVETALSRIEPDPDMVNRSDGEGNVSGVSVSSVGSPGAGDMGLQPQPTPRMNGRPHRNTSTPHRHYSENRRQIGNGELVDVGQLLQVQSLHDEVKKVHEKLEFVIENINELRRDISQMKNTFSKVSDDLYIFDEAEYPEDVLNNQYQPSFVPSYTSQPQPAPSFYPPPPRGVQGTSTVTYGAPAPAQQPPVIPLIPMRMPLDPSLASYQSPQNLAFYNQGALPFAEPQHLPEFLRPNIAKPPQQPLPPPVNVVITTSDTLPTGPPPVQPTLSVTIPPQHRLGTLPTATPPAVAVTSTPPHKFQIAMPATANIPSLEKSPIVIPDEVDSDEENEVGYDPCPDFRPIIPLPKEVNVMTGEEDDEILFENRAKLFRFVEKEWKERGVGIVKILKNKVTEKVRLLMRRDQVHKVCANHLLKSDMELSMLKNSDRALVWVANDFAEEVVQLEKFCIKFKTPEEATQFSNVFNDSKIKYGQSPTKPKSETGPNKDVDNSNIANDSKIPEQSGKVTVGGFTFISPPKLKDPAIDKTKFQNEVKKDAPATPSPFAAFSFTPQKSDIPSAKINTALKQSVLTPPLFSGLSNTQNKTSSVSDTKQGTPSESSPKAVVKEPKLPSFQPFAQATTPSKDTSYVANTQKPNQIESTKPMFSFTSQTTPTSSFSSNKETPKSILKEPLQSISHVTTAQNNAKSSPSAKHVLFQDTPEVSPSQQTPTLTALLTGSETQVIDFAALSKINENKTQFSSDSTKSGFQGAGSQVFGSNNNRERKESEGENAEEFVPSAEFKPVIPLPELVEVKTGEESEEVLFNERAKLMRFDVGSKEWKERGIGQMKILKDPGTGVTRFLMRREQVLKVCCNHRIIQSLELKASSSSQNVWTWYAVDYSEGETKNELFAIRFKTVELAKSFKETVDKVQKQLREESTSKRSCPDSNPQEEMVSPSNVWKCQFCLFPNAAGSRTCKACSKSKSDSNNLPKLSELFRPKTGSWECKACYTVNGAKENKCVSCDSPKEKPKSPAPAATPENTSTPIPSLAEMFKPKVGSWECGGCLVRNDADKTICPACSTPKPGHKGDVQETSKSTDSFGSSSFTFGVKPADNKATGFSFGIKSNEETPKSSFIFGVKPSETAPKTFETPKSSTPLFNMKKETNVPPGQTSISNTKATTPFIFSPKSEITSSSADSTTPTSVFETKPPSTNMFKFGNLFGDSSSPASKTSFVFGAPTPESSKDVGENFAFGQSGKFEFSFSGVKPARSPSGSKSPRSPATGQDSDSEPEDEVEEEADHLVFQPVVPLPDKVPLTTGEEDEVVLYSHRAKLYRFAQGEWKERGVGDIKILRHNKTHKIRFLMRREPILKICLNHFLTAGLAFTAKDDKSWLWSAQDFSEGQLTNEQFCLRLKTAEIASEFKAAVDSAQGELEAADSLNPSSTSLDSGVATANNEVEIVYEAKVSDELREAALKLHLPPNFYSYLTATPCPGCVGCQSDTEDEEDYKQQTTNSPVYKLLPTTVSSSPVITTTVSQPFTFTFTTTTAPPAFGVSTTTTTSSSFFSISNTSQSGFSFTLPTPSPGFGSTSQSANKESIPQTPNFSGFSLFKDQSIPKPSIEPMSIFGNTIKSTDTSKADSPLLFGTITSTQSFTAPSFENAQNSTPSLFGGIGTNQTAKESTTPFFSSSFDAMKPTSIFDRSNTQSSASVFGTPTPSDDQTSKGTSFLSDLTFQSTQTSLFGGSKTQSPATIFGTSSTTTQPSVFGSFKTEVEKATNSGPAFLFKPTTSFSDIVATNKQPFGTSDKAGSNFTWAGAGATVFDNKRGGEQEEDESGGEGGEGDTTHDPVFEPIIPLPDAIEVRTGEEEEEKEFCHRAKFYRYNTESKEWKERGIGDMKILRHRETNTYRLLLRREQVHKVVCNQLITSELELQPLAGSDKAFCWAGMNMAEEYGEPQLEKVAVRFKHSEIANEFKTKLEECVTVVKARKSKTAPEVTDSSAQLLEPAVTIEEVTIEYSEGDDGDYEREYSEGEDNEPMFEKRATLHIRDQGNKWTKAGQGELRIYFDNINLACVNFRIDGGKLITIMISTESNVQQLTDKEVSWEGIDQDLDSGDSQEYKAEFSSSQAAQEFIAIFNEATELSQTFDSSYVEESGPED